MKKKYQVKLRAMCLMTAKELCPSLVDNLGPLMDKAEKIYEFVCELLPDHSWNLAGKDFGDVLLKLNPSDLSPAMITEEKITKKTTGLTFLEAVSRASDGDIVRRGNWGDGRFVLSDGWLRQEDAGGKINIPANNLLAADWIVETPLD